MEEKYDFVIYANHNKMMVCFNVLEKDIKESVTRYNLLGRVSKTVYSYHKCIIEGIKEI